MKIAAVILLGASLASAEDAPKMMTKLMVKFESPEVPKDSFAAQPKRMYRAGSGFCRIEENPDLENGIHGLLITNEPDSWMINRLNSTARHILDPGPTYNCRLPIFASDDEIKTSEDLKKPMIALEFGRELEYFTPRSSPPTPGPVLQGKSTTVYAVEVGGWNLFLFVTGNPETPVAVVRKNATKREIFWYGEYEQLPFDAKLFALPDGIRSEEVKP